MPNFVDDMMVLPYPKATLRARPTGSSGNKYLSAEDWNDVCQASDDMRGAILNLRDSVSALQDSVNEVQSSVDDLETLVNTLGSDGGYRGIHVPATSYNAGDVVKAGPYLWGAANDTTDTPLIVEGNLGSASDWSVQTSVGSGMTQSGNTLLLIGGFTSSATTAYRQSINSGFLGKMLIVDLQISGAADWIHFGVFDAAAAQTATNINSASSGFYGLNINLFNQRVENWINGTAGTNSGYTNANITNAVSGFSRWYLYMAQNGSNWDLTLYRDSRVAGAVISGLYSVNHVDDIAPVAQFTNVARPSFTNWRFVIGARTGASAGTFRCRGAWVHPFSGNWHLISKLPTLL